MHFAFPDTAKVGQMSNSSPAVRMMICDSATPIAGRLECCSEVDIAFDD